MFLSIDIYEYLTNFVDYKTVLNMLSVNKKFSNDIYFERIIKRKYLLLVIHKKEIETWKIFYLRIINCFKELKEKYNVSYNLYPFQIRDEIEEITKEYSINFLSKRCGDSIIIIAMNENKFNLINYLIENIDNKYFSSVLSYLKFVISSYNGIGDVSFYIEYEVKMKIEYEKRLKK
jgi:hypothetical protein